MRISDWSSDVCSSDLLYERHNIIIAIRQATTDQLVQSLCDHELDCVLGRASAAAGRENLWHEVLYTQRPVLIGHDKLLQRLHGRRLDWRELATMDWILPSLATDRKSTRLNSSH